MWSSVLDSVTKAAQQAGKAAAEAAHKAAVNDSHTAASDSLDDDPCLN